ncbi:head-tail adaptor protein [Sphingomonas sp. ID0503]|uniref:phage head completion protein n=1 Tax=Sphingomonas sp. ID0503 TaxID=3399691 RepID=UPI003AFA199E
MDEISGSLSERVSIERLDATRDAIGGSSDVWLAEGEVWASVLTVRADGLEAAGRWRVTMRVRSIGFDRRIGWRGRWLRVVAVEDAGERSGLVTVVAEDER